MNNKTIIGIAVVILIAGGSYYVWRQGENNSNMSDMSAEEMENMDQMPGGTNSPLLAEENAVIVSDQKPGTNVIGIAVLASPGYFVIHEDNAGQPGAVLGASALLQAGENKSVKVTLTRAMKDGETLHAMLHTDTDKNGIFNASVDMPVQSRLGGPIYGIFQVSADANPDAAVSF